MTFRTIAEFVALPAEREAVLRQLARAHDEFSEREQLATLSGHHIEAEGYHRHALWLIRAYRAELDDPEVLP